MPLLFPTSFAAPAQIVKESTSAPVKKNKKRERAPPAETAVPSREGDSRKGKKRKHDDRKEADAKPKPAKPAAKELKKPETKVKQGQQPNAQPQAAKAKSAPPKDDLQSQLKSKLAGGRFRMLNAALYTSSGEQGKDLMMDQEAFDAYHEGFRAQAAGWPQSPVVLISEALKTLPKRSLVADVGCGDAGLAQKLVPLGIKVVSFDLLKVNDWVSEAEGGKLPLPGPKGAIVDAVVFCLSLMPTDWIRFIEEAQRVLVPDGVLKIAEVASRFSDLDEFVAVIERAGFSLSDKDTSNTHFSLFTFIKRKGLKNALADEDRVQASALLKPCTYKKR